MTAMPVAEWTELVHNYTAGDAEIRIGMSRCESALFDYTAREDNCPDYTDTGEEPDCWACNSVLRPFTFTFDTGMPDGDQGRCLNVFVGVMEACWEEPENAVVAQLTLAIDMPGPGELRAFKSSFINDVAAMLDGVSATDVVVTNIAPGSVIVDFYIAPARDGSALIDINSVTTALAPGATIAGATLTTDSITGAPVSAGPRFTYLTSPASAPTFPDDGDDSSTVLIVVLLVIVCVAGAHVHSCLLTSASLPPTRAVLPLSTLDVPIFLAGAAGVAFKVKRDGGADGKKSTDSEREAAPPPIPASRPVRLNHRVSCPACVLPLWTTCSHCKVKTLRTELRHRSCFFLCRGATWKRQRTQRQSKTRYKEHLCAAPQRRQQSSHSHGCEARRISGWKWRSEYKFYEQMQAKWI